MLALHPLLSPALGGVRHGFFGRQGGVSTGIYESLNAGPGSGDDPAAVEENRRRIAAAFGLAPAQLIGVYQTHSARAVRVSAPWPDDRPQADAMVSAAPGLALCILAADCAPVLLADRGAHVIGAAHAGWKGALAGIVEATIVEMERAGAARANIAAAIGPCIARRSYEVGPEFRDRFVSADSANAEFFSPGAGDRSRFDLKAYCAQRLVSAGIGCVDVLTEDTCDAAHDFFSNRRAVKAGESDFGRNASVIVLD